MLMGGHSKVRPVDLTRRARSIAQTYRDKGAIVLTLGADGVRAGGHGLNARVDAGPEARRFAVYADVMSRWIVESKRLEVRTADR